MSVNETDVCRQGEALNGMFERSLQYRARVPDLNPPKMCPTRSENEPGTSLFNRMM